jgi:dipeptide/tripeptide permease
MAEMLDGSIPSEVLQREGWFRTLRRHPAGFWFLFWGELAERFSYYGVRALLILYMIEALKFEDARAAQVVFAYKAACHLLPLAGGLLSDCLLGKYWAIVGFSFPYILGHLMMGGQGLPSLYFGLVLLAVGAGVVKPNLSPLMGLTYDQKRPGDAPLRTEAFALFSFTGYLGLLLASLALPLVARHYGYQVAFMVPAALMAVALIIFAAGKRYYAAECNSVDAAPAASQAPWQGLGRLFGVFALVSIWWCVCDQDDTLWTIFAARHMDMRIPGGWVVEPNQLVAVKPILCLCFIPAVNVLGKRLARRGVWMAAAMKLRYGFLLMALAASLLAVAGGLALRGDKVSVLWMIAALSLLTLSEVIVVLTGLELAFAAAPANMKSVITACWLLTVSVGNALMIPIAPLYSLLGPGNFFALMAGLMVASAAMLPFVVGATRPA